MKYLEIIGVILSIVVSIMLIWVGWVDNSLIKITIGLILIWVLHIFMNTSE